MVNLLIAAIIAADNRATLLITLAIVAGLMSVLFFLFRLFSLRHNDDPLGFWVMAIDSKARGDWSLQLRPGEMRAWVCKAAYLELVWPYSIVSKLRDELGCTDGVLFEGAGKISEAIRNARGYWTRPGPVRSLPSIRARHREQLATFVRVAEYARTNGKSLLMVFLDVDENVESGFSQESTG